MRIEFEGQSYTTIYARDILRKGRVLELRSDKDNHLAGEVFCSEETGALTISLFEESLPLPVIEKFIAKAHPALAPSNRDLSEFCLN